MSSGQVAGEAVLEQCLYLDGVKYPLGLIKDVAKKQSLSISRIRSMCDSGELIAIKNGSQWLVSKSLIKRQL